MNVFVDGAWRIMANGDVLHIRAEGMDSERQMIPATKHVLHFWRISNGIAKIRPSCGLIIAIAQQQPAIASFPLLRKYPIRIRANKTNMERFPMHKLDQTG